MIGRLLRALRAHVGLPARVSSEAASVERAVKATAKSVKGDIERRGAHQIDALKAVRRQVERLQKTVEEMHRTQARTAYAQRLLLQRIERLTDSAAKQATGPVLPPTVPAERPPAERIPAIAEGSGSGDDTDSIWMLEGCPVCSGNARSVVCEWNKLILLKNRLGESACRYDCSLCHACGVVYAGRRPVGTRYRALLSNFVEVTGKADGAREVSNPLLNPYPLDEAARRRLVELVQRGVFISDHERLAHTEHLPGLLKDRLENSVHVEILSSLVAPKGGRILEIRSRAGSILEVLRRTFQADVYAMPIWESQQFIVKALYGIPVSPLIDFDHFSIPFEPGFDLVLSNHMLTHVLRPREYFETVREHVTPGGYLYLYNEPDDAEFVERSQSMFASLNPLHMQAFDQPSLARALEANGFEVVFLKRRNMTHLCLARRTDGEAFTPMTDREREARIAGYGRARDRAILRLPEASRWRFSEEWPSVLERAVEAGSAGFDEKWRARLLKQDA